MHCNVTDLPRSLEELCQHNEALNKTTPKRKGKKEKGLQTAWLIREYLTVKSTPSIELHGWRGLICWHQETTSSQFNCICAGGGKVSVSDVCFDME